MPRYNDIINNFINGEVSPKLYGRSESEIYKRSCRRLENMIVYPQGGAARRVGSEFILDKVNSADVAGFALSEAARVITFTYSKDESYQIIFHGVNTGGYYVYIINTRTGHVSTPLFDGGVGLGFTYDSIGQGSVSENDLIDVDTVAQIQFAQSGDTMFFAHQDLVPFYLKRLSENNFYMSDFHRPWSALGGIYDSTADRAWNTWPFQELNGTAVTITPSASGVGAATLTASAGIFSADMEGTPIMITNSGTVGIAFVDPIGGFVSATSVTVTIVRALPGTAAYKSWSFSAFSKLMGYPRCVTFQGGRTIWASTKREPERFWFSQIGDIFELSNVDVLNPGGTKTDDDPGSFVPSSDEANEILWMRGAENSLLAGTRGREYAIPEISGAVGATINPSTSFGSEEVQPVTVDDVPVFVQRGFRKLREMVYDFRVDGFVAPEVTFNAEHMGRASQKILGDAFVGKIKALAYQALDNNVLWVIDTNGYLFAATKSRENSVTAFHRHELGGNFGGAFPRVLSIASGPTADGTSDNLYLIVKRTVNGATKITYEAMRKDFTGTTLHSDLDTRENQPVYLDCAKIFRPRNANFAVSLKANSTAQVAGGLTAGTTVGTVNYTEGHVTAAAVTSHISWDGTANADFPQVGCVRFTLHRYLRTLPASLHTILNISQAAGSTNNQIKLAIDGTATSLYGDITLTIRDSAGTAIINGVTVGNIFKICADFPRIEVELNYSLTAGATRLFINGKQLGSTIASTGTRTTAIDLIRLNANEAGAASTAGYGYSNLVIFNTVQHTADYEMFEHVQASTTLTKLDYLEGEDVKVVADGNYLGEYGVVGGAITLPDTYSTIIVGLSYKNLLEIQPIDAGTGIGSAMGSVKRIDRLVVRFNATAAASVGPDEDTLEVLVFRVAATPMGDPIDLVTDDRVVDFDGGYDRQARVVVSNEVPLPCNVTCLVSRGVTGDV